MLEGWKARILAGLVLSFQLSSFPAFQLSAQAPPPHELIDRVVAVVGTQPLLLSELNDRINQARGSGLQVPTDSTQLLALQRQMLGAMIEDEVLYQQARRDTAITVTDAEVQTAVDQQYHTVRGNFHTEAEFVTALRGAGWGTAEEYRRFLSEQSRRSAYAERYVQKVRSDGKMRAGTISEAEMRQFFDAAVHGGQLDSLPPTITFRQIVISPKPSDSSRAVALHLADSVRTLIEHGADFATMARQFSDDAGSKANGGDLGFFRRGTMVRQFEEVAFQMRPGVVSPIVRTEYGFHLIWVDRIQTGEIKARHILFSPRITAIEQTAAHRLADSVALLLQAGGSLDSLVRMVGDSSEPRTIGPTNRDSLPLGYAEAMATAQDSQLVGPAAIPQDPPERTRWLLARVVDVKPRRVPAFDEVREQVRLRVIEQKGYRNLIEDLKKQTYIDIRL